MIRKNAFLNIHHSKPPTLIANFVFLSVCIFVSLRMFAGTEPFTDPFPRHTKVSERLSIDQGRLFNLRIAAGQGDRACILCTNFSDQLDLDQYEQQARKLRFSIIPCLRKNETMNYNFQQKIIIVTDFMNRQHHICNITGNSLTGQSTFKDLQLTNN